MEPLPRRLYAPTVPSHPSGFGLGRVVKSAGDASWLSPPAVITHPVRDLQGDKFEPMGIDWDDFNGFYRRLVNLEHGPYIGTAVVENKSLPALGKDGTPDESLEPIALPVGVTTFFQSTSDAAQYADSLRQYDPRTGKPVGLYSPEECYRYAEQTYPLVMDGTLSGVSLEFQPNGEEGVAYKSLGPSPLLRHRPAYHFFKTRAMGYAAACERPVNPFAGYAPPDELLAKAEKALKVCEDAGTLDLIRKSLTPLADVLKHNPTNRLSAPVRRPPMSKPNGRQVKGMDGYDQDPAMATDPNAAPVTDTPPPEDAGSDMTATAAAAFNASQGLLDLCAMVRDQVAKGEHVKGKKKLLALCDGLEKDAADAKAIGDMVTADVGGGSDTEADTPEEAPAPETDETGGIVDKSFGNFRPRRFVKGTPYPLKTLKNAPLAVPPGKTLVDADHLKNLETLAAAYLEGQRN